MLDLIWESPSKLPELTLHLSLITALFCFVWWRALLNKGWLIDDSSGVAPYSDRWDSKQQKVIDSYQQQPSKKTYRHTQFNPEIGFPACLIRWLRINIGKKHAVIGTNARGHEVFGLVQDPFRHHLLSLVVFYLDLILAYFLLLRLFGPEVAFFTVLLFSVHPVACQAAAWISGLAYLNSLFGILIALNITVWQQDVVLSLAGAALGTAIASFSLLAGGHLWLPLLALGKYPEAILAALIVLAVILRQWGEVVSFRKAAFKSQNMGKSTTFNWRRLIVMTKTLWYYTKFAIWPMKLGLFHGWGYHFEDQLERFDRKFWAGATVLALMTWGVIAGPLAVKFGILWFLAFVATFGNAITAQQFVVDRYIFIPSLGYCLLAVNILQGILPLFYILLGMYAMRTIVHIPTFRSEIDFYLSNANTSNFLDNEVALGNLGVIYMNNGMPGSACDAWVKATKVNRFYDVPWYNLYSLFKTNGMLEQARGYLEECLKAKTVHFQDHWAKEMQQLTLAIAARRDMKENLSKLNSAIKEINA